MRYEITKMWIKGKEKKDPKRVRYDIHSDEGFNVAYSVLHPLSTEGDGPWISGLYVNPLYRRQGLGHSLVLYMEKDYEGQTVRFRASPYKDKAVSLEDLLDIYEKWGYTPYDSEEPTRLMKIIPIEAIENDYGDDNE